jgi:putative transposase
MPRTARASVGGVCYHVINRGNGRARVFHKDRDFQAFVDLFEPACERLPMRILAWCLIPNHFHLVLWPRGDGDLSRWMQWLMTAHVRRYHRHRHSSGHVWQGRFKAFPIQQDAHLLTVLRYVERNPLRAGLVRSAENWPWSSLPSWVQGERPVWLSKGPVDRPSRWLTYVNRAETAAELEALRKSVQRGTPFGAATWSTRTANRLGLEASLHPRGRPRKGIKK